MYAYRYTYSYIHPHGHPYAKAHTHARTHTRAHANTQTQSFEFPFVLAFHYIDSHPFRVWAAGRGRTAPHLLFYKQRISSEAGKICPLLF